MILILSYNLVTDSKLVTSFYEKKLLTGFERFSFRLVFIFFNINPQPSNVFNGKLIISNKKTGWKNWG